jgi:hypothetical protein
MKTLIANTEDVVALLPKRECIEDLAAAHHIWRKAEATGAGTWVEIGGRHYGSM